MENEAKAMYYGGIKKFDVADGPGVRVTLFVSGCTHHCEGCFQPETWDFHYGKPFTEETEEELLAALAGERIRGFTLLGGEPFEPENQRTLVPFLRKIKERFPKKDIWAYTGFLLLPDGAGGFIFGDRERNAIPQTEVTAEMLSMIDTLVDGEFVLAKRNLMLRFRGSENQRLIDLKASLAKGDVVLLESKDR